MQTALKSKLMLLVTTWLFVASCVGIRFLRLPSRIREAAMKNIPPNAEGVASPTFWTFDLKLRSFTSTTLSKTRKTHTAPLPSVVVVFKLQAFRVLDAKAA